MTADDQEEPGRGAAAPDGGPTEQGAAKPQREDASFLDSFKPTRLMARDAEDLKVFSALLQDAVVRAGDMAFLAEEKRFAMIVNRFRWEEPEARERVRTGVHFDGVLSAKLRGFDPSEKDQPLSLLAIRFVPAEDGLGGEAHLVFAGSAEAALQVETLEAAMADIGKPWKAAATPLHRGG